MKDQKSGQSLKLCCYVCGEKIGDLFSLVSLATSEVDRVFITHNGCCERLDSDLRIKSVRFVY